MQNLYAQEDEYRFSGKVGLAPVFVAIAAFIAVPILAILYALIDVYCPVAGYVSLVFVAGYGIGVAAVVAFVGKFAKCRSPGFLRGAGLVVGAYALYCAWVGFEYVLLNRFEEGFSASLTDVFTSPPGVWAVAKLINADGWYTIGSSFTPKGGVLWLFWIFEAMIIVGLPAWAATFGITGRVYCEECDRWCREPDRSMRFAVPSDLARLGALAHGDVEPLAALEPAKPSAKDVLRVDLTRCFSCSKTSMYQVKLAAETVDEEGKAKWAEQDITGLVLAPYETLQRIREIYSEAKQKCDAPTPTGGPDFDVHSPGLGAGSARSPFGTDAPQR